MDRIYIKNIVKYYGDNMILKNINFRIKEGEVCGLLGLNGAGKSTLMKIIVQMVAADDGEIEFDGQVLEKDSLSHIGALIECPPIYANLSAYDNLKVKALLHGIEDKTIKETMDIVNLSTSNKKAALFSTGMKMRLGIALALLTNPSLLLLDEPTNGLDPEGIEKLKELLRNLSNNGTSILFSTHQLHHIANVSDKIIILHEGKVSFDGRVNDIKELESIFFNVINERRASYV